MSDLFAFIRNIKANPSDATARLVFADWLEEHGEEDAAKMFRFSAGKLDLLARVAVIDSMIDELSAKLKDDRRAEIIVLRQICASHKLAKALPPNPSRSSPE